MQTLTLLPSDACCFRPHKTLNHLACAGYTAHTAIMDALRIARLHTFLQRLAPLAAASSRASAGPAGPASAAFGSSQGGGGGIGSRHGRFTLPGCGLVEVVHASPLRAVLVAQPPPPPVPSGDSPTAGGHAPAADAGASAAAAETRPELRLAVEWQSAAATAAAAAGGAQSSAAAWPVSNVRCRVSVLPAAAGGLPAAPGSAAAAAAKNSPAAVLPAQAAAVPEAWCGALAAMADAGEEALLLRGLAVTGPPLAALAAALAPAALAAAGWGPPGRVTLQSGRPPYGAQLLLQKVRHARRTTCLRHA